MPPKDEQEQNNNEAAATAIDYTHLGSVEKILTRRTNTSDHKFRMKEDDLQALRKLPGNANCIDCGMADPKWASVNLGIFVCLPCSGQHRALGTHVSFVRSVDMDSWSDVQLQKMYMGGNDQCTEFLEKHGVTEKKASEDKYDTPAAHLYQKVLSARIKGEPEPTELPELKKKPVRGAKRMEGFGSQVILPEEQPNPLIELFRSLSNNEDVVSSSSPKESPAGNNKSPTTPSSHLLDKIGHEWSKFMDSVPDLEATEVELSERDISEQEEDEEDDEFSSIDDIIDQIVEDNGAGFTNSRWSMATKEFKSQMAEASKEEEQEDLFQKIGNWWEKEVLKKDENDGITSSNKNQARP